jgi:hypothetical protein
MLCLSLYKVTDYWDVLYFYVLETKQLSWLLLIEMWLHSSEYHNLAWIHRNVIPYHKELVFLFLLDVAQSVAAL